MKRKIRRFLRLKFLQRLSIAGVIAVVTLFTAIFVGLSFLGVPLLVKVAGFSSGQWDKLEPLATLCALAFGVGAGILVLIELAETSDSRNLGIYQDVYSKFMSDEAIEARRYIYQKFPDGPGQEIYNVVAKDTVARKYFKYTMNQLDYFGFLADQDWVTAEEVIGWLSPVVVKLWIKIGPLAQYELDSRPEEPDYYEAAFKLVKRCQRWRKSHFPNLASITFDDDKL